MYIGIDLGTSGVKLILVDRKGHVMSKVTKSYPLLLPKPGWTEQNPETWFQETLEGLKEIIKGHEKEIKGISFSGQMHGLVILDDKNNVLRNSILWNDQRTVEEVSFLNETIGIDTLLEETGNIALTGLTAPKVLWVKNNEPELFKRIHKIMLPKDYIAYQLTGSFATDTSDVSGTLYYDVKNKKYSKRMLDILGITESQLPKVYESTEVIGHLTKELKRALGINNDVFVSIGGGDQAMGALGVGVVNDGMCSVSLGTSGVVFVSLDDFAIDRRSYLQSYCHGNGKYMMMGVMLNAAGALKWWNEQIFKGNDYDSFFENMNQSNPDEHLFFLPYLTGERSPLNDPYAKGVMMGLELHHQKEDLDRAVVEGISFALRDSFELIQSLGPKITTVRLTGGGAKSAIWSQMIANIFNSKVERIEIEEGPALGAAITAMVGDLAYPNVSSACEEIVRIKDSFEPVKDQVVLYEKKYQEFKQIYPRVKLLFSK